MYSDIGLNLICLYILDLKEKRNDRIFLVILGIVLLVLLHCGLSKIIIAFDERKLKHIASTLRINQIQVMKIIIT